MTLLTVCGWLLPDSGVPDTGIIDYDAFAVPEGANDIQRRMHRGLRKVEALSFSAASTVHMPLPSDERIVRLANDLLAQMDAIFGLHPGFRPVHAKGVMLSGTFTPSSEAASLTRAPHIKRGQTAATVRFSNGTGLPSIPDNSPDSNPHGLAIRFHLDEHVHTDIVSHSTDGFPTRTGQEFLDFLRALATGDPSAFLAAHPAALAFVQTPKPSPASFAQEAYFGMTAFRFINQQGLARYGRYGIVPQAGVAHLDDATAKA